MSILTLLVRSLRSHPSQRMPVNHVIVWAVIVALPWAAICPAAENWQMYTIDASSRGADGVRLVDVNADGLADIATGWEEGGQICIYLNPGPEKAKKTWPAVTVGQVSSPEDAVFVDVDGDGAVDVVSCCEGRTRTIYVHWAPKDASKYLDPAAWTTEAIPATEDRQMWMFCVPMQVDHLWGIDLVVGSKGAGAMVGWLQAAEDPRDLNAWKLHRLRDAGWIMSLILADMDADGDEDILFSDRRGPESGMYWLELVALSYPADARAWDTHAIGATGSEIMFIACEPTAGGREREVIAAVKPYKIQRFQAPKRKGEQWTVSEFDCDPERFGTVKAVRAADMTGDGKTELVITCEHARGEKSGVFMASFARAAADRPRFIDIGGAPGVKYDRIELLDLDGDDDLDILTCEEADNLGVIWYENPLR